MKAMVLRAPGELVLEEVEVPRYRPENSVLIRVTHSGVCGTDLKIFRGAIDVCHPLIMGHEIAGEIADPGENAQFREGNRVVVDPMISCGACFHCRAGQTNLCPDGVLLGRDADGGFAEYVVVPPTNVFHLPPTIATGSVPLIQVMATCLHAQRLTSLFPGESVVILGLGVAGQIHAQLAKARGASPVIGITRSRFKQNVARALGADMTFRSGDGAVEKVLEATNGRGVDMVIESTGAVSMLADAIKMARPGGRLLLFGIYTAQEVSAPLYELYFKELALLNARAAKGEDFERSVELVRSGVVKLKSLVTHVIPLSDLKRGIEMNGSDMGERLKVIVEH